MERRFMKSKLAALLLCIFLGAIGVHRFYVGKIGTGILWLLTGGVFGIGVIVDIILIATDNFLDGQGNPLQKDM
ncbi:MAG: TM2 domain-containing protein [Clostridia bacterium]|nr:TM2 domain-containing protein [Clostridia bacterium]